MSESIGNEGAPLENPSLLDEPETLQKPKRKMSEKQLATLKKGQEVLKQKRQQPGSETAAQEGKERTGERMKFLGKSHPSFQKRHWFLIRSAFLR